jgi:MiaB-like tRNA modifying enzyme
MNVYLETHGCTANQSDARTAHGLLLQAHHTIVPTIHQADILLLLTCTVIDRTEQRMLSRIRLLQHTGKPLIIAGCMAAVQPHLITTIAPHATLLPPNDLHHLPDLIAHTPTTHPPTTTRLPKHHTPPTAPIAIAEGCNYACAYCITHHARGPLHSHPITDLTADLTDALHAGCRDIHLTAQDTAAYGHDTHTTLPDLLTTLTAEPGDFHLRVGMMNPHSLLPILDPLIRTYHHPKIYKFLHLPLQAGDDTILTAMNRDYTTTQYLHCVNTFRQAFPDLTLITDIIVGYPGETDQQATTTYDFIEALHPAVVNVTRYSARPLTTAKTLPHRIPTHIMKTRSQRYAAQALRLAHHHNQRFIGKQLTIYLTEYGTHDTTIGRTPNYNQVVIPGHHPLSMTHDVEIIDAKSTSLFGKLI